MAEASSLAIERYVPIPTSLSEDAPGWASRKDDNHNNTPLGPICWKCRGTEFRELEQCPVCRGEGRLPVKRKEWQAQQRAGRITRARRHATDWTPQGPEPYAWTQDMNEIWKQLLQTTERGVDVDIPETPSSLEDPSRPVWLPKKGHELCNLVGRWRILQAVGSHRWTTDDLVTATVASRYLQPSCSNYNYLDLGTGNGSVLQIVLWAALRDGIDISATGIEARSQAVALVRRSLAFNVGPDCATILHGDFRTQLPLDDEQYDLITGTPPYFRVDFAVKEDDTVTAAVIRQGGMPSCRQSAPARCEFRGGIEAYCQAAQTVLKANGTFCVCENWANHERVLDAAAKARLTIVHQVFVQGREGRGTLFGVYVMRHAMGDTTCATTVESLTVRNRHGEWTDDYKRTVLDTMSIPYLDDRNPSSTSTS